MSPAARSLALALAVAGALPWAARGQVYAALDDHGQLQISTTPVAGAARFDPHTPHVPRPVRAAQPGPAVAAPAGRRRWAAMVEQVAAEYAVDARLLHAIVQTESNYNPGARSHAGALGLMQVIPSTGRRFGATDLFDPVQNLRAGTAYLVWLDRQFGGDLALVLAAYNAGEGAVRRHGLRVPPYRETRAYVQRVTHLYRQSSRHQKDPTP